MLLIFIYLVDIINTIAENNNIMILINSFKLVEAILPLNANIVDLSYDKSLAINIAVASNKNIHNHVIGCIITGYVLFILILAATTPYTSIINIPVVRKISGSVALKLLTKNVFVSIP
jgi:hypothetical protein